MNDTNTVAVLNSIRQYAESDNGDYRDHIASVARREIERLSEDRYLFELTDEQLDRVSRLLDTSPRTLIAAVRTATAHG